MRLRSDCALLSTGNSGMACTDPSFVAIHHQIKWRRPQLVKRSVTCQAHSVKGPSRCWPRCLAGMAWPKRGVEKRLVCCRALWVTPFTRLESTTSERLAKESFGSGVCGYFQCRRAREFHLSLRCPLNHTIENPSVGLYNKHSSGLMKLAFKRQEHGHKDGSQPRRE